VQVLKAVAEVSSKLAGRDKDAVLNKVPPRKEGQCSPPRQTEPIPTVSDQVVVGLLPPVWCSGSNPGPMPTPITVAEEIAGL
jgi:hypothetical protein